ncbi:MAG: energy transducer TonB [Polyangiales bacterium]
MLLRFGSYVFPSLMVHCAFFVALASSPVDDDRSSEVEAIEYITITEEGGGRLGDDKQIGDAVEPEAVPEKKFRQIKRKPKRTVAVAAPTEVPTPKVSDVDESDSASDGDEPGRAVASSHSMVMGSAGTNPGAVRAGSGSGQEGIDRRSALRAWLREIQREVNKIATRNYPSSAVRMKLEGKLSVGITIGADGRVLGVRVLSSSGHSVLDESATDSVMALHIPAPPDELGWREREISLPIRYALQ